MSGAPERRYTDADVRREADLTELAKEYLEDYFGDFEPLVEAQQLHLRGLVMPTPIVRKVLNCMRNDANWAHLLPRPGEGPTRAPSVRLRPVPEPEEEDEPRERPYRVDAPAAVHWLYGCPRMRGNLHVVEVARVWWYLPRDPFSGYHHRYSQVGQRVPHLEVRWVCGNGTTDPRLSPDGEDLADRYITCCKRCFDD